MEVSNDNNTPKQDKGTADQESKWELKLEMAQNQNDSIDILPALKSGDSPGGTVIPGCNHSPKDINITCTASRLPQT